MLITLTMDLTQLSESMGAGTDDLDAARWMRTALMMNHPGKDTFEVPESDWLAMLEWSTQ